MLELDGTLIVAMISFIIFAFIMNAVLYRPIINILDEREKFLSENSSIEKSAIEETEKITEKKNSEIAEARAIASKQVSESLEKFKQEKKEATLSFNKTQKEKVESEKQKLEQEAKNATEELSEGIENISDLICNKILGEKNV